MKKTIPAHDKSAIGGFADRLKDAVNAVSRGEVARGAGVSESVIGNYLAGKSMPSLEKVPALAAAAGVRPEWLAFGIPPMRPSAHAETPTMDVAHGPQTIDQPPQKSGESKRGKNDSKLNTIVFKPPAPDVANWPQTIGQLPRKSGGEIGIPRSGPLSENVAHGPQSYITHRAYPPTPNAPADSDDDYVTVYRYGVEASAGVATLLPSEEIVADVRVRRGWVRRELGANPDRVGVITAKGDSMEPTIQDGDHLLVDLGDRFDRRDGIYVLGLGDRIAVKRLQWSVDGGVKVISDNPAYHPELLAPDNDALRLIGRVIWSGSRL